VPHVWKGQVPSDLVAGSTEPVAVQNGRGFTVDLLALAEDSLLEQLGERGDAASGDSRSEAEPRHDLASIYGCSRQGRPVAHPMPECRKLLPAHRGTALAPFVVHVIEHLKVSGLDNIDHFVAL